MSKLYVGPTETQDPRGSTRTSRPRFICSNRSHVPRPTSPGSWVGSERHNRKVEIQGLRGKRFTVPSTRKEGVGPRLACVGDPFTLGPDLWVDTVDWTRLPETTEGGRKLSYSEERRVLRVSFELNPEGFLGRDREDKRHSSRFLRRPSTI